MSEPTGQILPDSNFGRVLTRLAINSNTIVELGCWRGGGSTMCLAAGLVRPEQRMWSIDISAQMVAEARERNPDDRITFLCGTVLKPEECEITGQGVTGRFRDSMIPTTEPTMSLAVQEMAACSQAPYIGDQIPEQIDLCLFDGGEYSTRFEFLKLFKQCKVIACDDIRRDCAWKNYRNHYSMMNSQLGPVQWNLMFHHPYERNGWSVFIRVPKRPNGKLFPLCQNLDDIDRVISTMNASTFPLS